MNNKFKEAEIRTMINMVSNDTISFSRFVELINERIKPLSFYIDIEKTAYKYYGNAPGDRSMNIFKHGAEWALTELKNKNKN